ncbi:DUF5047 domain-containing protein [Actinomadura rayongensis]|uniref:DUF5047 domain-containing protein n=1 Tax=Actinomadura rayongensis TaxID=1429076 RepID=A0A6I4WF73_9ACTN|nr:DUF5047 domain-containing protein [Actinomadura rayongensis]MXQ67693.1 DUF5047 domain-containing protein [Actinomadura rayongensis]
MYPVSASFLDALRAPHQMTARVELWSAATKLGDLAFSDGTVTLDRSNTTYGTCDITAQLIRTRGLATDAGTIDLDAVNVYGLTLRPYRGVVLAPGRVEEVPLGRYLVEKVATTAGDTSVKLSASGFRSYLRDDKFLTPYAPASGTAQRDVVKNLITGSRPGDALNTAEFNALPTTPVASGTTWESDRLAAVEELATALGVTVQPDRTGTWRFAPVPDPRTAAPAWTIDAGRDGVLTKADLAQDRASVYNAVVATGETTSADTAPVRGTAYLTDATSPARWGGPFGRRPYFYSSAQLSTTAAANAAATAVLRKLTVADTVLDLESAPNPALDVDDAVLVVLPDGTRQTHIVDAVTIPLTPAATLTVSTRQRPDQVTP